MDVSFKMFWGITCGVFLVGYGIYIFSKKNIQVNLFGKVVAGSFWASKLLALLTVLLGVFFILNPNAISSR